VSDGPLALDRRGVARLRSALVAAGFTTERVTPTLRSPRLAERAGAASIDRRRLGGAGDAFSTLASFFLRGGPVDADQLAAALAPSSVDELVGLGLAHVDGDAVHALFRLAPHGELYIVSDLARDDRDASQDVVAGVQGPSVTLAKLTRRTHVERALDLGTGCGIQALLAARHAGHVVATDVNERALGVAAFNALLNEVENIEFRLGSGLEPVAGERFGLVTANPPYVISPESTYFYRDSGLPGDTLCRQIVRGLPGVLTEGGYAHLLASWVSPLEGDVTAPVREWVAGMPCDAWILHYKTEDPITHSMNWLQPLEPDPTRHEKALDTWLAYLSDNHIDGISYGALILRGAPSPGWIREDAFPMNRLAPAGDHIRRVFDAQDVLQADDTDLLDRSFRLVERHHITRRLVRRDGAFRLETQTLSLDEGLGFDVFLDRDLLPLLPHLAGGGPLREALTQAAAELPEAGRAGFPAAVLPAVRRLLELGLLEAAPV
jgi:hypothetical protein